MLAAYAPGLMIAAVLAFGVVLLAESAYRVVPRGWIALDTAPGLD